MASELAELLGDQLCKGIRAVADRVLFLRLYLGECLLAPSRASRAAAR